MALPQTYFGSSEAKESNLICSRLHLLHGSMRALRAASVQLHASMHADHSRLTSHTIQGCQLYIATIATTTTNQVFPEP